MTLPRGFLGLPCPGRSLSRALPCLMIPLLCPSLLPYWGPSEMNYSHWSTYFLFTRSSASGGTLPRGPNSPSLCLPSSLLVQGQPLPVIREPTSVTSLAEVIYKDDLLQQGPGCCVQDAVHSSQERGPGLIVEAEDDAGCRQTTCRMLLQTPAREECWGAFRRRCCRETRPPMSPSLLKPG